MCVFNPALALDKKIPPSDISNNLTREGYFKIDLRGILVILLQNCIRMTISLDKVLRLWYNTCKVMRDTERSESSILPYHTLSFPSMNSSAHLWEISRESLSETTSEIGLDSSDDTDILKVDR